MIRIGTTFFFLITLLCNSFSQSRLDDLTVYFKHDFEGNSLGTYNESEWSQDWLYPEWSDREVPPEIVRDPDNPENSTKVMQWNFPAGSLGPKQGGGQWESKLNNSYPEMYFSYDIRFKPGFDFVLGGKMPGLFGGPQVYLDKPGWEDGFGATLMFKQEGRIVFYTYSQGQPGQYGETSSWEKYVTPGNWNNITFRIVMNTIGANGGNNDGLMEAFFDGKLVYARTDMIFRNVSSIGIDGLRIYSHFGGGTDDWRNTRDEWIQLDNFMAYTFENDTTVPTGNNPSPAGRTINYWRKFSTGTPATSSIVNNPPIINTQTFLIEEKKFEDNYIGKISAYDKDPGQALSYKISSGNENGLFKINSTSGDLMTTTNNLFANDYTEYNLAVMVSDNGAVKKSTTAPIKIGFLKQSTTVYIDPENIQDPAENGTMTHPFDSWQDVTWQDGYVYLQKKGTTAYESEIKIGSNNVSLGAYGNDNEVPPVISSETSSYFISGFENENVTISNLRIQAMHATSCIYFLGTTNGTIVIEHCIIEGINDAIRMIDGKNLTLKYNSILGEAEGVFSTAEITEVYYNIFRNNAAALRLMNITSKAKIFNNVFFDNQESVASSTAELTLFNNVFYFTASKQKAVSNQSGQIASDHNIFYPEQDGFMEISGNSINKLDELQQQFKIDLHSFTSDPKFEDVYESNFRLKAASPAIDAGISLNLEEDFFRNPVPIAGLPDIGICEYTGENSSSDNSPKLTVYPNPSSGNVNIVIEKAPDTGTKSQRKTTEPVLVENQTISIVDMSGKTLFSKILEDTETIIQDHIDLSGIANGFYFVVLHMADKIVTSKLIINR